MPKMTAVALFLLTFSGPAFAQTKNELKDHVSITKHSVAIGGKKIDYEAAAGTLVLKDEEGKATASIFYIAYTRMGEDLAKRPVTFSFNGGPGSSSVWLHLGVFGPKRVLLSDEGEALRPPAKLVENDQSILDLTDLVFIDPVSTGYSRAADEKSANKFHGVEEDVQAVGEFIRLYTTRNKRWQSPKYIAGESYGTTRAAFLSQHLQSRHGISLNGVLLISSILNFQTTRFDDGNELPFPLFLPTYTATAWYHKKLSKELQGNLRSTLEEAQKFAEGEYTVALMKGSKLTDEERQAIARKLARLTGLTEAYILRADLRIEASRFMRELLREPGWTVGRFDSRIKGKDANHNAERPDTDFSYHAVQGPYSSAFNQYVRTELGFESDLTYEILTGRVQPWNYAKLATNRYLNVAPKLRDAMTANKHLRVFIANGYYDLATPYFATEYTVTHLGGDKALAERITLAYYEAGHMMYIHQPSLRKLREDLAGFLKGPPK